MLFLEKITLKFGYPKLVLAELAKLELRSAKCSDVRLAVLGKPSSFGLKIGRSLDDILAGEKQVRSKELEELHPDFRPILRGFARSEVQAQFVGCANDVLVSIDLFVEHHVQEVLTPLPTVEPSRQPDSGQSEKPTGEWGNKFQHTDPGLIVLQIEGVEPEAARAAYSIWRKYNGLGVLESSEERQA